MKKVTFIFCLLSFSISPCSLKAQVFEALDTLDLPNLSSPSIVWADLDNNGYQDAIVSGKSTAGIDTILLLVNKEASFELLPANLPSLANASYKLADFNHDAFLDIFMTGTSSSGEFTMQLWENRGGFLFVPSVIQFEDWSFGIGCWADLDRNGSHDLIIGGKDLAGNNQWVIYKNTAGSFERISTEIPLLDRPVLAPLDADIDGDIDLVISGVTEAGTANTWLLNNLGEFKFEVTSIGSNLAATAINIGDFNHDGRSDIVLSGRDNGGNAQTDLYVNLGNGNFDFYTTLNNWLANDLLMADLDKNGWADIFFAGYDESNQLKTSIYQYDTLAIEPAYILLDTLLPNVLSTGLSDADNDGDLDVLMIDENEGSTGLYINNFEGENLNPSTPTNPFAIAIHGRTMFSWVGSIDDHTPQSALTYEIFAGDSEFAVDHVSPYFNTIGGARKMPQHGTSWQSSFYSLNKLLSGEIFWGVHPIDNSLANNTSNGICFGNVLYDCVNIDLRDTVLCFGNTLELVDPVEGEQAIWFSVKQGYLGTSDTLNIELAANDTIFYVVPNDLDCALATSWDVKVLPSRESISLGNDTTVCQGEVLEYVVPEGDWSSIVWLSATQGSLGSGTQVNFEVTDNDTLTLILTDTAGCVYEDDVAINIINTSAYATGDTTINSGESAQLAGFNALSYLWSPDVGIDDINVQNPVVSPLETTPYVVEMQDVTGCIVLDTVVVIVETSTISKRLFIPNLFTPNNDGSNDTFKLYGLEGVSNISFHIFDTQGNIVFESEDVNTLQSVGWDGYKGSRMLRNGTYFWRLEGRYQSGTAISFNGKNEGYLTLLR